MSDPSANGFNILIAKLTDLVAEGVTFDNRKLMQVATEVLGGGRLQGAYTSRDAYDAMETAAHKFLLDGHARELMHQSVEFAIPALKKLTAQLPTQTDRTQEQSELQQFSTPPAIAFLAVKLLDPQANEIVLEPSAGTGSLALWPRAVGARVICNEISERRRALLKEELGFETYDVDAEMIDDVLPQEIVPTCVAMNPPFSATGGRVRKNRTKFGLLHVESALCRLAEGGRLVTILGEQAGFEYPGVLAWWKKIADFFTIRANVGLHGRQYAKYGTTAAIQVVVIDKTGPTSGDGWKEQLGNIIWGKAASIEKAWAKLSKVPGRSKSTSSEPKQKIAGGTMFLPYLAQKIQGGKPHPAVVVEAATMAAVSAPDITYRPHLPIDIVREGKLSDIQLERVIYAGQRHEQRLPDGARGGFYVGDGTGVGKGRVLAGIIADNYYQDRRRALWLSVNNDLLESTKRDLNDLGLYVPLARINDYAPADRINLSRGVIFSSYNSLISVSKKGAKRLDQIQEWLGSDGVIIFDEAHRAKNALASGIGQPTLTGLAVIDLQDPKRNPEYRVVYSSATGATDVRNMAYMVRLGLWGPGSSFPGGFTEFLNEIESGGVGAMEMVSRDLKSMGMYLSASLSFGECPKSGKAVEFRERVHRLTEEQRTMYNRAAEAWQVVLRNIDQALQVTNAGPRARGIALNKFWGDHQRCFRQIIASFKVPSVIDEVKTTLAAEKSAVISLVGTGEAKTREQVAKIMAEGGSLEDLDFSPREIIAAMVERGFPTVKHQSVTEEGTGRTIQVPVKDKAGNFVHSARALKMKQVLIDGLSSLELPENPLDQLVNHFGEDNVGEITGRTRRLIRDPHSGTVQYRKRAPSGISMDRVNTYEMEQFQRGRKRIAIISDAGSIGISLHASNRAENRQRRVHITLELGWSADKQLQSFGRTHRSDQAVPPEYVLVSTELGGERRFSSTIARRLASLGALTKGDRGAADNADLSRYNFETEEGRASLGLLLRRIETGSAIAGLENPKQTLRKIGLLVPLKEGGEGIRKEDSRNVPRFLNRILALQVDEQNALFDAYVELFDQTIRFAKANGTFNEGVTDLDALAIRLEKPPRIVHQDAVTGAETTHYLLDVDVAAERVSFERVNSLRPDGQFFEHKASGKFIFALNSGNHTDPEKGKTFATFSVWRPDAARTSYINEHELNANYAVVTAEAAQPWWTAQFESLPHKRTLQVHIIAGAIIPLWQRLKTNRETQLSVVRVSTDKGERIVGILVPPDRVGEVLRSIGLSRNLVDPGQIFHGVLEEGEEVQLVGGLKIVLGRLQGEKAIELDCSDPAKFPQLRKFGLLNEQIKWKQRFFIPLGKEKGLPVLNRILDQYPVVAPDQDEPVDSPFEPVATTHLARKRMSIVLEEWVISPVNSDSVASNRSLARSEEPRKYADERGVPVEFGCLPPPNIGELVGEQLGLFGVDLAK